jgi:hypothetical protein
MTGVCVGKCPNVAVETVLINSPNMWGNKEKTE